MLLMGIDLETTAVEPQNGFIIEFGIALWDTIRSQFVRMSSSLIKPPEGYTGNTEIPLDIQYLTGITGLDHATSWVHAKSVIYGCASIADYIVAHNASFEREWLDYFGCTLDKPWIDTMTDLPYSPTKGHGPLTTICQSHGIHNIQPHRALPDTIAMMQLLARYEINSVIELAKMPMVTLEARCPNTCGKLPYDLKDKAKALGYKWSRYIPDAWAIQVKQCFVQDEQRKALENGFDTLAV